VSASTVGSVCAALERAFPLLWAEEWDAVGLRVGDPSWPAGRALITLDANAGAIDRAVAAGCDLVVTHHPPFLEPIDALTPADPGGALALLAARAGVAVISMHTNLDRSPEGAEALPALLGLRVVHPLEEPVVGLPKDVRMGRLCEIESEELAGFASRVGRVLGVRPRVWGDPRCGVRLVAVGNGSVRSLIPSALAAGADVLLGGEVRYHDALDAVANGLAIIEAGHDSTEWPLVRLLADVARTVLGDEGVIEEPAHAGWWIAEGT
jgi:dinuclear metal center YbgI/SA1388 family protein